MDQENEVTTPNTVDNTKQVFLPSVFEQAQESLQEFTTETSKPEEKVEPIEFSDDDVNDLINTPFDLAAILTKHKGFELTEKQAARLTRVWKKPMQRHLGTVKGMDIYLALVATTTILTDKTLDFLEHKETSKQKR